MILKRLCDAAHLFEFPPFGYQEGPVKWIIDLRKDGRLTGFIQTSSGQEARRKGEDRGLRMVHPFAPRSSGVEAQLLADKATYVLGLVDPEATDGNRSRAEECQQAFRQRVIECAEQTEHRGVQAVAAFLSEKLPPERLPPELQPGDVMTFQVSGNRLIDDPVIQSHWARGTARMRERRTQESGTCLVCAQAKPLADRMPVKIKPVPGGQTSGCALVSANAQAFESYGREAALISPICWDCAQRHAEVLNKLLTTDTHNFTIPGHLVYVFWTREPSGFSAAFCLSRPQADDVKRLMQSVEKPTGNASATKADDFYALALCGSGGRVVVRDWLETTVASVQANLVRYFKAQHMVDADGTLGRYLGIRALMGALTPSAARDAWSQLPPNLTSQVVRAALAGAPLPDTLLCRAIARARAECPDPRNRFAQHVTHARAAVIKMALLLSTHREEGPKVTPKLNPDMQDPAYLCGRLLAVLENLQEAAAPGIKATVVDRYYGTASSAPASVFGNLMRLAQSHLGKLRKTNEGAYFRLQRTLEDVGSQLPAFPHSLNLIEQGKFALGYYQQRAAQRAARDEAVAAKRTRKAAKTQGKESE